MGTLSGRLGRTGRRWSAAGIAVLLCAAAPALAGDHGHGHDHGGGSDHGGGHDHASGHWHDHGQAQPGERWHHHGGGHHDLQGTEGDGKGPDAAVAGDTTAAPAQGPAPQQHHGHANGHHGRHSDGWRHGASHRARHRSAVTPVVAPAPATAPVAAAATSSPARAAPRHRTRHVPARVVAAARAWAKRGARPAHRRARSPRPAAPVVRAHTVFTVRTATPAPRPKPAAHPKPAARQTPAAAKRSAPSRPETRIIPIVLDRLARTAAVVPGAVWGAFGALAMLAFLMLALALVRDRRARALTRERDDLLADLEALESAVLPILPEALGGLALSVSSAPAAKPVSGGDFHDAFALSRDRVAVILGDVAGHGGQALSDAQLVRHAVRAYLEAGLDPRAALAMTGTVVEEREEPLFASVVVAVHDRSDGTVTFASAGHEPPIIVAESGAALPPVAGWSPPLGTGLETGRRQTSMPLPEGAALCLVTDGVTEARAGGERLGVSHVIKWLSALGPGAMSSELVARLREEADTTDDDATVCMLRALTPPSSTAPRIEEAVVEGGDGTYLVRFLRDCGLPLADAEEAGDALAAMPDGTRIIASVEIRGGRAVVELAPLGSSAGLFV
jgi:hypothetical protein